MPIHQSPKHHDHSVLPPPMVTMLDLCPSLASCTEALTTAFRAIATALENDGCLYICGNGGSMSDALHISGELLKSYTISRPLSSETKTKLRSVRPDGERLAEALQHGLRAVVLGLNHSLSTALENDVSTPAIGFAQELLVMARPGDVLLGISTSGNARNIFYAAQVAHALELSVIALTGQDGGRLAALADIAIRAPASRTDRVQEMHVYLYHCLCEMLEIHFFGSR